MNRVFLGLGSNQNHPQQQVLAAIEALRHAPNSWVTATSELYISPALSTPQSAHLGPSTSASTQADYVNAVVQLNTTLPPLALLNYCQQLEHQAGRPAASERQHWGPRPLDIDVLLYANQQICSPRLNVPHPEMPRRAFVLQPLFDIAPGTRIPGHAQSLENLLASCPTMPLTLSKNAHNEHRQGSCA